MELKVWVDGIQRIVCGVTQATTCQDVVFALAHATSTTGRFTLIERWRSNERLLAPSQHPLKVLLKWGEHASDVQFILQRTSLNYRNDQNLDNKAGDRGEHGGQELQIDPSVAQQRNTAVSAQNRNNICNNNVQNEGLSPLSSTGSSCGGGGGRDIRKSLTFSGAMVSRESRGPGRGVPPYDPAKVDQSSAGSPDVSNGVKFGAPTAVCVSPAVSCVDTNPALNSSAVTEMSPVSSSISPRSHEHPSHQRVLSAPIMPHAKVFGNGNWRSQQPPHNGSSIPNAQQPTFQNTMHDRNSPLKTPPIIPPPGVRPAAPPPYELVRGYPPSPPFHGGSVRRRGYRQSSAKGVPHHHTRQHSSPAATSSDRVGGSQHSPLRYFSTDTAGANARYPPQVVSQGNYDLHATHTRNTPPRSQHMISHPSSSPHQTQFNSDFFPSPSFANSHDAGVRPSSANSPNKYDLHKSYESPYGYTTQGGSSNQGISPQAACGSFYQYRKDSQPVGSNSYVENRVSSSTSNAFALAPPNFSVDQYNHSRRSAFHAVPNKSDGFTPPRMLPPYRPPPPPPAITKSHHINSPGSLWNSDGNRTQSQDKILKPSSSGEMLSSGLVSPSYAREHYNGDNSNPNTNNRCNNTTYPSSRSSRESGRAFDTRGEGDSARFQYFEEAVVNTVATSSARYDLSNRDRLPSVETANDVTRQIKKQITDNLETCNGLDTEKSFDNSAMKNSSSMSHADKNNELSHGRNGFHMVSSKSVINSSSSSVVSLPKCNNISSSRSNDPKSESDSKAGEKSLYGITEKQNTPASLNSSPEWASYPSISEISETKPKIEASLKCSTSSFEDRSQKSEIAFENIESTANVAPSCQRISEDKEELSLDSSTTDLCNDINRVENSENNRGTPIDGSQESNSASAQKSINVEENVAEEIQCNEGEVIQDSSAAVLGRQVEHIVLDNIHQDLVTLVNKQRDQLTGQQILLTKFEAEITYLEGRWREDQAKLSYANAEMERLSLLLQKLDDELAGQDPSLEEEELKTVLGTKEQLTREMSAVHQQIQQCDAQIAHLTNSITSLEDELLSLRLQEGEGEEDQDLQSSGRDREPCVDPVDATAQPPSPELAKMLMEVESALAGKREQVEELKRAVMTENLEALSLTPPDRLVAATHTPAGSVATPGAGGSGRRMLGPPRMLETAVPTSKNPHGVWV